MIPRAYITEWTQYAPWKSNEQVEQDLVICRVLVEIFSDTFLSKELAFRGGTALHKLYLHPQARYSEDIDLVQINEGPIGLILDRIRALLRSKGRDLYDQYKALIKVAKIDINKLIQCYRAYMHQSEGGMPTQELYIKNIEEKMNDPEFIGDTTAFLRPEEDWNAQEAYQLVKKEILEKI